MKEARFDLYKPIHKLVRSEMFRISTLIGSTNFGNEASLMTFEKEFNGLMMFLKSHNDQEEKNIHPLLEEKAKEILIKVDEERGHSYLTEQTSKLDSAFSEAKKDLSKCHTFYLLFNEFVASNLVHLNNEENLIMPALHANYSDKELIDVHQGIMRSMPQEVFRDSLKKMLPVLNHNERIGMYMGMKQGMPPEAFTGICMLANAALAKEDADNLFKAVGIELPVSVSNISIFSPKVSSL